MEEPSLGRYVRIAIEFMTMYMAADDQPSIEEAAEHIKSRLTGPDAVDPEAVIVGQLLLGQALLIDLAQGCGVTTSEGYRAFAGEWLREHAPFLGDL
ncbi:hypothetical protein [Nocardia sp. XZ_19_385]|uniref:hypothetical protein n=1 Tax=Nocardia sp. XZ_19_385 TaxID=2769488 RepID=UPI00188FCA43|nr:hypothetical protein [Nocardia sp. XZ_19_385]